MATPSKRAPGLLSSAVAAGQQVSGSDTRRGSTGGPAAPLSSAQAPSTLERRRRLSSDGPRALNKTSAAPSVPVTATSGAVPVGAGANHSSGSSGATAGLKGSVSAAGSVGKGATIAAAGAGANKAGQRAVSALKGRPGK